MLIETNIFVVLGAAAAIVVIGFIWYHPKVFGAVWRKMMDRKKMAQRTSHAWAMVRMSFSLPRL